MLQLRLCQKNKARMQVKRTWVLKRHLPRWIALEQTALSSRADGRSSALEMVFSSSPSSNCSVYWMLYCSEAVIHKWTITVTKFQYSIYRNGSSKYHGDEHSRPSIWRLRGTGISFVFFSLDWDKIDDRSLTNLYPRLKLPILDELFFYDNSGSSGVWWIGSRKIDPLWPATFQLPKGGLLNFNRPCAASLSLLPPLRLLGKWPSQICSSNFANINVSLWQGFTLKYAEWTWKVKNLDWVCRLYWQLIFVSMLDTAEISSSWLVLDLE